MKTSKDFQPNNRLISDVELSPEAIAIAERFLKLGNEFHNLECEFTKLIPDGCYHQFYGKWDILIVRESTAPEPSTSD